MTTEKATNYAALCLYSPPERLGIKAVDINWDDIKAEKFSIDEKSGFYNQLTNQRELNITMKAKNGEELTVMMDAYNGNCLEVTAALILEGLMPFCVEFLIVETGQTNGRVLLNLYSTIGPDY